MVVMTRNLSSEAVSSLKTSLIRDANSSFFDFSTGCPSLKKNCGIWLLMAGIVY